MPSCSCRHHHAECARRPNKKDQVKVVQFILDEQAMYVGRTGTLIAMDASNEGIIKLDTGESSSLKFNSQLYSSSEFKVEGEAPDQTSQAFFI
eukprot:scaffold132307_cov21-Tisochrysis_lutea.AAC.2